MQNSLFLGFIKTNVERLMVIRMKKFNFKCNSKNDLKGNVGITLIALVISIIVLLILAGVSINTLTGENRNNNKNNRS